MIHLDHIHPLTDFKRNTTEFRERLRRSGLPTVLTVEGRPELVVQDAGAYQKMLDVLDRAEAIEGIQRGIRAMDQGRGRPVEAFDAAMRRKHKIPRRKSS